MTNPETLLPASPSYGYRVLIKKSDAPATKKDDAPVIQNTSNTAKDAVESLIVLGKEVPKID